MKAERFAKRNQAARHSIVIAMPHFCLECGILGSLADYRALSSPGGGAISLPCKRHLTAVSSWPACVAEASQATEAPEAAARALMVECRFWVIRGSRKSTTRSLGHVPIIDKNPRAAVGAKAEIKAEALAQQRAGYQLAEDVRYNQRSAAERVNGRLKDDFGGRHVRVRGHTKISCHLMFGVLALTCDQLLRLIH
jgi:Transposase DDE domain